MSENSIGIEFNFLEDSIDKITNFEMYILEETTQIILERTNYLISSS